MNNNLSWLSVGEEEEKVVDPKYEMEQKNLILSYEGLAKPSTHGHFTSRIVSLSQQSTNKLSTACDLVF